MKTHVTGLMILGLFVIAAVLLVPGGTGQAQETGSCTFTATVNNITLRSGPGTSFSEVGTLNNGQTLTIVGREVGADFYVWWQSTNNAWVRSDLGTSDCPSLCGDGVCEFGEDSASCSADCTGVASTTNTSSGTSIISTGTGCFVDTCENCYDTVSCYPDCNVCSCDLNEFGCVSCYCDYADGADLGGGGAAVTTYANVQCTFTADHTINLREGPGTSYPQMGQVSGDTVLSVVARDVGVDGYVWWESVDAEWMRSDLGVSDCPALCGDGVCEIDETLDTCAADCSGFTAVEEVEIECVVGSCDACYETIDCYPDCDVCSCDLNEFGCPSCFCGY